MQKIQEMSKNIYLKDKVFQSQKHLLPSGLKRLKEIQKGRFKKSPPKIHSNSRWSSSLIKELTSVANIQVHYADFPYLHYSITP